MAKNEVESADLESRVMSRKKHPASEAAIGIPAKDLSRAAPKE